jgi:hypothetical protein
MLGHIKKAGLSGENSTFIFAPGSKGNINVGHNFVNAGDDTAEGTAQVQGPGQGQGRGVGKLEPREKFEAILARGNGQKKGIYKQAEKLGIDLGGKDDEVELSQEAKDAIGKGKEPMDEVALGKAAAPVKAIEQEVTEQVEGEEQVIGTGNLQEGIPDILKQILSFFAKLFGVELDNLQIPAAEAPAAVPPEVNEEIVQ